jgi:hypothetical protein
MELGTTNDAQQMMELHLWNYSDRTQLNFIDHIIDIYFRKHEYKLQTRMQRKRQLELQYVTD